MIVDSHRREERRSKEVGCQWESPEEDRKEVGCQSQAVERRDAAVQVDLLTQQLSWRHSGVSWHCGAIRVDEPAGGILLQLCRGHTSRCVPCATDRPALLPSVPLFSEHESSPSTSMPPLTPVDVSAAPPGLIAPLSPGLAEDEEQEEEQEVHVPEEERLCSENMAFKKKKKMEGGRWPDGGERQKSSLADKSTNHIAGKPPGKRRRLKMKLLEKDEESHTSKRGEKQTTRIQERKKNEGQEEEERGGEETMKEGGRVKSVIMKTEEAECQRPRRRMVGPTVRYLLESEQQSHGPTEANHSRASRDVGRRKTGRPKKEQKELDDSSTMESSADGGAERWWKLCQVCGLNFTSQPSLDLHLSVHRPALSCAQAAADQQQEQTNDAKGDAEEREEPQRPRRTVCQPIRYLLESSHGSVTANQTNREAATKPTRRRGRSKDAVGGRASEVIDRPETNAKDTGHMVTTGGREEGEEEPYRPKRTLVGLLESEETSGGLRISNQDAENKPTQYRGRSKNVFDFNEAGGGASKMTDCSDTEDKEMGHTVSTGGRQEEEEPQRPGKTVSPPIRRLLESEASVFHPSVHRPKRLFGCHLCNRKFSRASRLFRHQCNQHHSNIGGLCGNGCGSALSNARAPKNKQEKQTTQDDKEEPQRPRKPLFTAPTGAPYWSRDINRVRKSPSWLVDYWTLNKRRNGRRGTKRSRVEEDDEEREAQQVCVEKEEGPQRPRRTTVGPPIRYLLESEVTTRGSGKANQTNQKAANKHTRRGRAKDSVGGGASKMTDSSDIEDKDTGHMVSMGGTQEEEPQRPGTTVSPPVRYLLESEVMSHDSGTANQNDQEAVIKLTRRRGRSDAVVLCEAGGGASEMIDRLDAKDKDRSHVVVKGRRKEDEKMEEPQRPRRTMVGPPIRYLLESEELSCGQRTANQDTENKPTHSRRSPKKASVLHRPKRVFGCHICNRKFSRASRLFLHHCDQHRSILDSPHGNRVGMAMSSARASDSKLKEGTQGNDENGEESQRQRRTRVGPPIRYLLESEEPSRGLRAANQSAATKPTQRKGRMKAGGLTKAGGGTSQIIDRFEAAVATERQTGVHRQTYLVHRDLQDGQVTISPCSVTMQRLL
ncbi:unnamed protein product [Oreochromis niloticus]|nr:unnamed protein product [Mustela putorius furo]